MPQRSFCCNDLEIDGGEIVILNWMSTGWGLYFHPTVKRLSRVQWWIIPSSKEEIDAISRVGSSFI